MAYFGAFRTKLEPKYVEQRDALADGFPSAYSFLRELEALADTGGRFHLGTKVNLHLYDGQSFLFYLGIEVPASGRPSLRLSPQPYVGQKKAGTQDVEAPAFVKGLVKPIMDLEGFRSWAELKGTDLHLSADTPGEFFEGLLATLRAR
jgi:hypothetical protein